VIALRSSIANRRVSLAIFSLPCTADRRERSLCVLWLLGALLACGAGSEQSMPLAPGEFRLTPSAGSERVVRRDPARGLIEHRGLSLVEQIAAAWNVSARDLEFRLELPAGPFDVSVRSADGANDTAEALLRGGLAESLGLRVRAEARYGDVFALRLAGRGLVPETVAPGSVVGKPVRVNGHYRGAGEPVERLVRYLRDYAQLPIVDETGLAGHYDIVVEWDSQAGSRAFRTALADAGFVLAAAQRRFVMHVVEPMR